MERSFFPQTIQRQVKWRKTCVKNSFSSSWFSHTGSGRMTTHTFDMLPGLFIFTCNSSLTNSSQSSSGFYRRWLGYHSSMTAFHKNEAGVETWLGCPSPDLLHGTAPLHICQLERLGCHLFTAHWAFIIFHGKVTGLNTEAAIAGQDREHRALSCHHILVFLAQGVRKALSGLIHTWCEASGTFKSKNGFYVFCGGLQINPSLHEIFVANSWPKLNPQISLTFKIPHTEYFLLVNSLPWRKALIYQLWPKYFD